MERPIVTVPRDFLRLTRVDWDIDWRGQPSKETTDGATPFVQNAFPRWRGTPTLLLKNDAILRWRAIRASAQGRLGVYRFPMIDPLGTFGLLDDVPRELVQDGIPFSTGSRFSTGSGFAYLPTVGAVSAVPAGAVSLEIDCAGAPRPPWVGQIMSHDDWPFLVTSVLPIAAQTFEITVEMPIRRPIPAGGRIQMMATGLFLASEAGTGNPAYQKRPREAVSLALQEYVNR